MTQSLCIMFLALQSTILNELHIVTSHYYGFIVAFSRKTSAQTPTDSKDSFLRSAKFPVAQAV
jgi:hypothetical protein